MQSSFVNTDNLEFVDQQYQRWRQDPRAVHESWRIFFEGFDLGLAQKPASPEPYQGVSLKQVGVLRLIDEYRCAGHQLARLDPLSEPPASVPQLELANFGLDEKDLDVAFDCSSFLGLRNATLKHLLAALRETYSRTIGVEYMHIQDASVRRWLQEKMEPRHNHPRMPDTRQWRILLELSSAELFEEFLHSKFLGQKRFSLEGAETLIPLLNAVVEQAADHGATEMVLGMAHRGRLNVLANVMNKPYTDIFTEFEDNAESSTGDGDVKYHLGFSCDRISQSGNRIHLSLTPNPSHLEAVNPVVEGRVRAKQHKLNNAERNRVVPLLIHGDAAVAGQGLVAETLNLSQLQGYRTGGTIHIVVNNQIGFTTKPADSRSTRYCTDIAKMIEAPIFHVNAEDPDACLYVADLAVEFRQKFGKDIFIDMYCYRKWGHNEGDEPAYTQPVMYKKIQNHPSLSEIYAKKLIEWGVLTPEENDELIQDFKARLERERQALKEMPHYVGMQGFGGQWKSLSPNYSHTPVPTGVPYDRLLKIAEALGTTPDGFHVHPKIVPILEARFRNVRDRKPLSWGEAEMLAYGSLLLEGVDIRISGQDCRRGTFSHRHAVVYDQDTEKPYTALQHLDAKQARFSIFDSLLSEAAVLGFEYGYSLDLPNSLVIWEAQFGDFVNGAQVIIDQFLVSASSKWNRDSGLTLLLPHGYEGSGPEHSSARLERFLQLCGEDNIQVINPTTPAQFFHALRRQMKRNFRKPLIVMTPKSLLRYKGATSSVAELEDGHFHEVADDTSADPARVRRVIVCSGKVYYDLLEARTKADAPVALVRLEQFYPFPSDELHTIIRRYPKAKEVVWAQEESLNMGGWFFIEPRLRALGITVKYVGRDTSASPATGSHKVHVREQKELVEAALHGRVPHLVRARPKKDVARRIIGEEPVALPHEPEPIEAAAS
jgi:2-oxoglutarate dehydrogenase E1 component